MRRHHKKRIANEEMRLSTVAAHALIEMRTGRAKFNEHQEKGTTTTDLHFSSQLTGDHAARILDAAPITFGLLSQIPTPSKKNAWFMLAVRNLSDSDEQCLHPKPVKNLKGWFRHFLHTPLFQRFNLVNEPDFPELLPPNEKAWSTARFSKNGTQYLVIATCAMMMVPHTAAQQQQQAASSSSDRDTIIFHMYSPSLPVNHDSMLFVGKHSSQVRRSVGTHMAMGEMCKAQGMTLQASITTTIDSSDPAAGVVGVPDHAIIDTGFEHGDALSAKGSFERLHLAGAIHSYERETASGSAVIPLVMRHCFFLGPALSSHSPVEYDIVQPHRYAYLFRVRFLSGWELLGAVNLYATDTLLRATFSKQGADTLQSDGPLLVASPERWAPGLESLRKYDILLKRAHSFSISAFMDAMVTHNADVSTQPFLRARAPSTRNQTTDAQKSALPKEVWRSLICTNRIERMQESLDALIHSVEERAHAALGDRFLSGAPLTDDEMATVLYEALHGLAELLLPDDIDNARTLTAATTILEAPALSLNDLAPRVGAALLTGKAPRQWAQCALSTDEPVMLSQTLSYIGQNPEKYVTLLGERIAALKPSFFENAWLLHSNLAKARADAKWCVKTTRRTPDPTLPKNAIKSLNRRRNGLVYYLFSRDTTFRYRNWQ